METISLSGSWILKALDQTPASLKNSPVEYNNTNSVYTTLLSKFDKDEVKELRGKDFEIERSFNLKIEENERISLVARGVKSAYVNGEKVEGYEITRLVKNGENSIKMVVSSSYFGDVNIIKSTNGSCYGASIRAKKSNNNWVLSAKIEYEAFINHALPVKLSLLGNEKEEKIEFKKGLGFYTIELEISEELIEPWSIAGDGKQITYNARIQIGDYETERNIAFRTIEVRNGALYVNDRETFVMGAVWPVELSSDQKRYDMMLSSAAWANMNALLIEEGHESHAFYSTCDRLGLIVLHNEKEDEEYTFHPSYVVGKIKADIYKAVVHDESYYDKCIDAINLERWTLKTRSDNSNHGVIYSSLLSTVKEDGKWRPSHYAARRFFSDLVPIMYQEDNTLYVYVSNDGAKEEDVDLSVKFMTYAGQKRNKRMFSEKIMPHTAKKIAELDLSRIDKTNEFVYIKLRTFSIHRELTLLLDDIKKIKAEKPSFEIKTRKINSKSYSIRIISNKPAFAVHLELDGISGNFSDSFFEVRPAGEKSVIFTSDEDLSEEEIMDKIRLYDLQSSIVR